MQLQDKQHTVSRTAARRRAGAWLERQIRALLADMTPRRLGLMLLGAAILTFGICNVHRRTGITEGGVLGLLLFVNHWTGLPASIVSPVLDLCCYAMAWRVLGAAFLRRSLLSTAMIALWYKVWESLPPLLPDLGGAPLLAAVAGALFVGIGVGLIVRQGGSSGGDDALALVIARRTGWRLARSYLITDLTVLALSLSYIPALRIAYSLITVTISSFLIDKISAKPQAESEA